MGDPSWAVILPVAAALLPSILLVLLVLGYVRKLWLAVQSAREFELVGDLRETALLRCARLASLWRASRPIRTFDWNEHPSHVMTAVEHGWAAFAFSYSAPPATWFSNAQLAASPQHQQTHLQQQQVSMWALCHTCANSIEFREPETKWITNAAGEYMQQIRFNPGVTRLTTKKEHRGCIMPVQAVQSAMPLPGPTLGPCPYPQEAYFEISILAVGNEHSFGHSSLAGSEHTKLIATAVRTSDSYNQCTSTISACKTQRSSPCTRTDFDCTTAKHYNCRKLDADNSAKATHNGDNSNKACTRVDIVRSGVTAAAVTPASIDQLGRDDDDPQQTVGSELAPDHVFANAARARGASLFHRAVKHADEIDWDELLTVGLAAADAPPFRLPGFEPSSVGFLSADGQCYVNGSLHHDVKDHQCNTKSFRPYSAVKPRIVGCGFEPQKNKVYFTVNGELIHEVSLKATAGADFGKPLYPTLASNFDVTVLVNLGQSSFQYMPANVARVANPSCCQLLHSMTAENNNGMFYDDSTDGIFSVGPKLHTRWLSELEFANSSDFQHHHVLSEAESDLFEIVLDGQVLKR